MSQYLIKELAECDWQEYKSIRLRSLKDSADSFASTYEQEVLFQTDQWKSRLRISPSIHDAVALAAIMEKSYKGLLSCVIHGPEARSAHLYQMWVAPELRGGGVGMALVKGVKKWAFKRDIENLLLSVTTINVEAISLYEKLGFETVGETEMLREGSDLKAQLMQVKLSPDDL